MSHNSRNTQTTAADTTILCYKQMHALFIFITITVHKNDVKGKQYEDE